MVKISEDHLEENTKRLLRAALGSEARPSPKVRTRTFMLLTRLARTKTPAFPDTALALLGCLVFIGAVWLAGRCISLDSITAALTSSHLLAILLALNLIVMPFAGLVIILRRRSNV
jgi:hypothetical protein